MRSLIITFGWCGFGLTDYPDLFPELCLGCVSVSWLRGSVIEQLLGRDTLIELATAKIAEVEMSLARALGQIMGQE